MQFSTAGVWVAGAGVALCLLGLGVSAAGPGAADAGESDDLDGRVVVHPRVLEPGETVEITTEACELDTFAIATSKAFLDPISLEPDDEEFELSGVGEIRKRAKPGRYRVEVECAEGDQARGHFRVVPRGGPDTGGGGTAMQAGLLTGTSRAAADRTGLPAGQGAALGVLTAVGLVIGGWVAVGSRRRMSR